MHTVEVVAAIIMENGCVLATQRSDGAQKGWWEFPGGKIEPGENAESATVREIQEELGMQVAIDEFLVTVDWDYDTFHLTMHCFICHVIDGQLELHEHMGARWLSPKDLESVRWLPADVLVVKALQERHSAR